MRVLEPKGAERRIQIKNGMFIKSHKTETGQFAAFNLSRFCKEHKSINAGSCCGQTETHTLCSYNLNTNEVYSFTNRTLKNRGVHDMSCIMSNQGKMAQN